MLVGEIFDGFKLNNEFVFDHEVHFECAEVKVVLVKDIKRLLLFNSDALLGKSMSVSIFINFSLRPCFKK